MSTPFKYRTYASIPSVGTTCTHGTYHSCQSCQAQIREAQADLKAANEKLVKMEQRKESAKTKAKQTVSLYYETYAKLEEALAAKKRAEEKNEIQKSRVAELEQAVQRTEGKRHKELEKLKNEHAQISALFQKEKQELSTKIEFLNSELRVSKEEKSKLVDELEASRDEERKSKKALVNVASTLDEVSSEAKEAKKALFSSQVENENYKMQIEDLKSRNEKYESMLSDANREINNLTNTIKHGHYLIDSVKRSEEEKACMEYEINRLTELLRKTRETEAKKIVVDCSEDYDIVFPESTTSFVRVCVNEGSNGNMLEDKDTGKGDEIEDYNSEVDLEMWESLKIDDKEFDTANFDHGSGGRKKNKALLGKIGSLIKKRH